MNDINDASEAAKGGNLKALGSEVHASLDVTKQNERYRYS